MFSFVTYSDCVEKEKVASVGDRNKLWKLAHEISCSMKKLCEIASKLEGIEIKDVGKLTGAENRRLRKYVEENSRRIGEEERKKLWQ